MSPAEIIYGIGESIVSLDFSQSFESSETSSICPNLQLTVTNVDNTALEADKFEFDPSTQVLFVLTSDISLRGVYDIKMYVRYPGNAYNNENYASLNISADLQTCTPISFGLVTTSISEWTVIDGYDINEGDVESIFDYSTAYTLDEIKNICKTKDYSGFLVGKDGTHTEDRIYFKKVDYQLTPDDLTQS